MFKKFGEWLASIFKGKTSNSGSSGSSGGTDYSGFFNVFDNGTDYSGFFKDFIEGLGRFFNNGSYNNEESFLDNVFGTNLGELLKALTNRITAGHLTGAEQEANAFNAEQAQINRDFEERMASSQFQRQVADMQAAGVNPALAMQGSGNAAPSGVAASSAQPSGPAFNFSDLMQIMLVKPQAKLLDSQAKALRENAASSRMSAEAQKSQAESSAKNAETNAILAQNQVKIGDSLVTLNESKMREIEQSIKESESRISLQDCERLAKNLEYQFDKDLFETNKELVIQQLAYRAVEMSNIQQMTAESRSRIALMSQDEVKHAWITAHPKLAQGLDIADGFTSVIGNVFHASVSAVPGLKGAPITNAGKAASRPVGRLVGSR